MPSMQDVNNVLWKELPVQRWNYEVFKEYLERQSRKRKRNMSEIQDGKDLGEGSGRPEEQANSGSSPSDGASYVSTALHTSRPGTVRQDGLHDAANQPIAQISSGAVGYQLEHFPNQDCGQPDPNIDPRLLSNQFTYSDEQNESGPSQHPPTDQYNTADNCAPVYDWNKPVEQDKTDPVAQTYPEVLVTNWNGERSLQEQDVIGLRTGLDQYQLSAAGQSYMRTSGVVTGLAAPVTKTFDHPIGPTLSSSNNPSTSPLPAGHLPAPSQSGSVQLTSLQTEEDIPATPKPHGSFFDAPGVPARSKTRPSILKALATTDPVQFMRLYPNDLDSEFGWIVATKYPKKENFIAVLDKQHRLPREWADKPVEGQKGQYVKVRVIEYRLQNKISKWISKYARYFGRIKGWNHNHFKAPDAWLNPLTWREDGCPKPTGVVIKSHVVLPNEQKVIEREQREAKRQRTQGVSMQARTTGSSTTGSSTTGSSTTGSSARTLLRGRTSTPSSSAPQRQNIHHSGPVNTPPSNRASLQQIPSVQHGRSGLIPNGHDSVQRHNGYIADPTSSTPTARFAPPGFPVPNEDLGSRVQSPDIVPNHANIQHQSRYIAGPTSSSPTARIPPPGFAIPNENLGPRFQSPDIPDFSSYYQTPSDDDERATLDTSPIPARFSAENSRFSGNHPPAERAELNMVVMDALMSEEGYEEDEWKLDDSGYVSHPAGNEDESSCTQNLNYVQEPARNNLPSTVPTMSAHDQQWTEALQIAESNLNVTKVLQSLGWEGRHIRRAIHDLLDFAASHPDVESYVNGCGIPEPELEDQDPAEYEKIQQFLNLLKPIILDDCWDKCRKEFERCAIAESWILPDRLEQWESVYDQWTEDDQ